MITEIQNNILIGAILGDSSIQQNGSNYRIRFEHSRKQKEYCTWKHTILSPYTTKLTESSRFDERTQKTYDKIRFSTKTDPVFNHYYKLFYPNGKKYVPHNIQTYLQSEITLAIWYLDDGYLRSDCNALRIHVNSFTYDDSCILQETLATNFQINSTIHKQGAGGFNLYIPSEQKQSEKFCSIIKPFVKSEIPSMLYKLL